jgi:uncharacterized coiled-coil protein SlyX
MTIQDEIARIAAEQAEGIDSLNKALAEAQATMETEAAGLNEDLGAIDMDLLALEGDLAQENDAFEQLAE